MLLIIILLICIIPALFYTYMAIGLIASGKHKKSINDFHTIEEIDIQFHNEINEIKRKNK